MPRRAILAVLALALAACSQGPNPFGPTGDCCPTIAGGPEGPRFADYRAARAAFSRTSKEGVLTATLKDAAWLRLEGDPQQVVERHRDYFDYVYTSFEVVLRTKEFTNPSQETFLLEDSSGVRLSGSPIKYRAEMIPVEDRHQFTFDLSFNHQIGTDLQWIRLTRVLDGERVEWTFTAKG